MQQSHLTYGHQPQQQMTRLAVPVSCFTASWCCQSSLRSLSAKNRHFSSRTLNASSSTLRSICSCRRRSGSFCTFVQRLSRSGVLPDNQRRTTVSTAEICGAIWRWSSVDREDWLPHCDTDQPNHRLMFRQSGRHYSTAEMLPGRQVYCKFIMF